VSTLPFVPGPPGFDPAGPESSTESDAESNSAWSGLHYRRSLASRVTVLTTLAVGFAV